MKIELNRTVRRIFTDTNKEDIKFEIIFTPENVEEALKLKELEQVRKYMMTDGFYNDEWRDKKFVILLS